MRKLLIVLIASTGVLSGCSDFLSKDPDNRTYIDTPERFALTEAGFMQLDWIILRLASVI